MSDRRHLPDQLSDDGDLPGQTEDRSSQLANVELTGQRSDNHLPMWIFCVGVQKKIVSNTAEVRIPEM